MFSSKKKKYSIEEVSHELACLSLSINVELQSMIKEIADSLEISYLKVETEYRHFRVFIVETVIHTIMIEIKNGDSFLSYFYESLSRISHEKGLGIDFCKKQKKRTNVYDLAWNDTRNIGPGVAMASALASLIRSEDDILEILPLSLNGTNLLVPLLKYLRKIHIS